MKPRYLLDTNALIRWLSESRRLSKEQLRVLRDAARRGEPFAISAMTLLELALLFASRSTRFSAGLEQIFAVLESDPAFLILPFTTEVARETSAVVSALRDPADAAIVATARVHGLRLLTSDQRIIASNLVSTIE